MNTTTPATPEQGTGTPSVPFTVIDLATTESHGDYETLEAAHGCIDFDKLTAWRIWQGENIVEEHNPPTLATVLEENRDEVAEDLEGLGFLGTTDLERAERGKLLAFADRLFKHLAADEARITEITTAARNEVAFITSRYQALAAKFAKTASWKRFCLEQLAGLLFPDAKAKPKSVNLPYGTLGRRDRQAAPELLDEEAALARCFATGAREFVKLTIKTNAEEFEDLLVSLYKRVETAAEAQKGTITELVRAEVDKLLAPASTALGTPPVIDLAWSELKKTNGVALWALDKEGKGGGVKMAGPSTEFYATCTEG